MTDPGDMVVFAKVVEVGSFTGAAAALGVSKATVSKRVSALEAALGAQLLHRTTRNLALTERGEAFAHYCAEIARVAEQAAEAMSAARGHPAGLLRVSAPSPLGTKWILPILSDLLSEHPDLSVELDVSNRMVDLIEERFDVAIRISQLPDSSLISRRVAESRRLLCASPAYLARCGTPTCPADLQQHHLLHYGYEPTGRRWVLRRGSETAEVEVVPRLQATSGEILSAAMLQGMGIAHLPVSHVFEHLAQGRLVRVLAEWWGPITPVYAVYPATSYLPPKVRVFIDAVAEAWSPVAPWLEGLP